jgi:hypothetical protein
MTNAIIKALLQMTSVSLQLVPSLQYFFYFATFSMKKNKKVKVEGFHPRSRLRSAATPQYPSKLKN